MGGGLRYAFVDGEARILGFTEGSESAINYCLTVCLAASHRADVKSGLIAASTEH
jgi:hypothetical protein